jgi:hypothetical protein
MWLNLLMDDWHFNNIAKIILKLIPNHIWKIRIYNFSKYGHILNNINNVVKDLMNAILNSHWNHKCCKSIQILKDCKFTHDMFFF